MLQYFTKLDGMHPKINQKLRRETSQNSSGQILGESEIPILREKDYRVESYELDGDAPKQFIRAYIFERDSNVRRNNPKTWIPYIAKTAAKWYPHESVIEYLINRVGQVLGLNMNAIGLFRINGQIRFLSRYFRKKDEILIHGAEICGDHLQDREFAHQIANDKKTARELFTFEFVKESIEGVFPEHSVELLEDLVRILVFDCLVGNNDRHFYNWAVIRSTEKREILPRIAPIYDSSRGLFWNYTEDRIVQLSKGLNTPNFKRIDNYLKEACPRISVEGNQGINHFELISHLASYNREYRYIVSSLSSVTQEEKVLWMFRSEFHQFFTPERNQIIELVIKRRFQTVRDSLNHAHKQTH